MLDARRVIAGLTLFGAVACASPRAPGMVAAPSAPASADRPELLVAFPASACTGADSAVFLDESGRFLGAVAPGTAASLPLASDSQRLIEVSSADVTATPRTTFLRHEVPHRVDQAIVVEVPAADGHNCKGKLTGPLVPVPRASTLAETRRIARDLTWLEVRSLDGDAWLDANRARVDELVGRTAPTTSLEPVVTTVVRRE